MNLIAAAKRVIGFIRSDSRRFWWEVGLAITVWGITTLISYLTENRELKTCQDERTVLLRENARHQSLKDSIHYTGIIQQKDQTISEKDEEILELNRRRAADSIQLQSALQSVRALNAYINSGKRLPK